MGWQCQRRVLIVVADVVGFTMHQLGGSDNCRPKCGQWTGVPEHPEVVHAQRSVPQSTLTLLQLVCRGRAARNSRRRHGVDLEIGLIVSKNSDLDIWVNFSKRCTRLPVKES